MLLLVLADNLLLLYAGWELVGLCSYLLIGFWFEKPSAATAAKKAFITTRIGDTGMLIGLFVLFAAVGSFQIPEINRAAAEGGLASGTATAAALLLFAGARLKICAASFVRVASRRDEGSDSRFGVIHAATMVTAGVYRSFAQSVVRVSEVAGTVVAVVGVATALYAAILAWPRTTSSASLPTRRSVSSDSCSWPPGTAHTAAQCSIS